MTGVIRWVPLVLGLILVVLCYILVIGGLIRKRRFLIRRFLQGTVLLIPVLLSFFVQPIIGGIIYLALALYAWLRQRKATQTFAVPVPLILAIIGLLFLLSGLLLMRLQ